MIIWFNEIGISFVRGGGSEPPACDAKPLKITFSVEDGMEYRYYYDTDTSKWYIRNDQGQYEEYGRYDASSATTYEGKLVVSDGYEYEWDGTQWVNLGEVHSDAPDPSSNMTFEDANVKAICVANWGSNGEITYGQAASVTDIGTAFIRNSSIIKFDEFRYFTGVTSFTVQAFGGCTNLQSITIPSSLTDWCNSSSQPQGVFYGCRNLRSMKFVNPEDPTTASYLDITDSSLVGNNSSNYWYQTAGSWLCLPNRPIKWDEGWATYTDKATKLYLQYANPTQINTFKLDVNGRRYRTTLASDAGIYVPTGLIDTYKAAFSGGGYNPSNFNWYEYDFETDPDHVVGEPIGTTIYPKYYPSIDTYDNWADSEFNYPETFNTQDSKWWVKNNQGHYEEYGIYADSINSGVTTYEGKLALIPVDSGSTVDEYEYSGGTWNYLGSGSSTPYTEVEYLQRTTMSNIPCFDTGIRAGGTTVFKGKLSFDANIGYNYLVGNLGQTNPSGQTSSSDNNDWRLFVLNSGGIALDMKNLRGNTTGMTYNTMYNIEFSNNYVKNLDSGTYYYSGTPVDTSWESGGNVFLFCPSSSKNDIGKIGACQIFNDGVLVRDFVPCLDENEVPSFYDKVTRQYFHSITSSVPTAGSEVSPTGSLPKEYADKPAPDLEMVTANIYCDLYQDSAITAGNYIGREAVVLDEAAVYKVNSGKKWEYLYPISNTLTYTTTDGELIESIPASGWGANLLANIVLDGDNTLVFNAAPTAMPTMSGQTKLVGMELPEGLTSIPAGAFSGCTALRSIDIPSGVTSIGDNAFRGCTSITGMILPSGLTSIGSSIFYGCSSLESIDIPNSVTSLGAMAFSRTGLRSVTLPSGITSIPMSAFEYCPNLSSVTFNGTIREIGNYAFGSTALRSFTIPDSVTNLGTKVFQNCGSLSAVTVGSGITSIPTYTFNSCTSLNSITYRGTITSIGDYAFRNCAFTSWSAAIPSTVTSIGEYALVNNRLAGALVIPDTITNMGIAVVENNPITSLTLNNTLTVVPRGIAYNCSGLTEVVIPAQYTQVDREAFAECRNLSSITCYATTAPVLSDSGWFRNLPANGILSIPRNADYSTWLAALPSGWSISYMGNPTLEYTTSDTLTYSVPMIGWDADNTVHILSNTYDADKGRCVIEFDGDPTIMPESCFQGSTTLTSVEIIPNTITKIEQMSFSGCTALTGVTLNDGLVYLGDVDHNSNAPMGVFDGCTALLGITIPNTVQYLGNRTFCQCTALSSITLSENLLETGRDCFFLCSSLTSITYPDTMTVIGQSSMNGCSGLTYVNIPNGITEIKQSAFRNCTSLPSVIIPSGVTTIGNYAFQNSTALSSITCYATTAPTVGSYGLANVAPTGTLYVPSGSDYSVWINAKLPSGWTVQDWTLKNFLFNINAKDYDATTNTFANASGATFTSAFTMNTAPAEVGSDYLQLSGNSIIFDFASTAANPFNMDASKSMTLIFKVDVPSTYIYDGNIFCNRNNSQYNWMARIEGTSPNQVYYFHDSSGIHMTNTNINQYAAPYTIASVISGTNCTSYFWNGTQWVTVTQSGAGWSKQSNKFSLFYETADGVYFNCKFYWAYIADRALTLSEIQEVVTFNDL